MPIDVNRSILSVITRVPKKKRIVLIHVLNKELSPNGGSFSAADLNRQNVLAVMRVADRYLAEGGWPIIGAVQPWSRGEWPMGLFRRQPALSERILAVSYDDNDLTITTGQNSVSLDKTPPNPDVLFSPRGAEIYVSKIIRGLLL